MKIDEFFEKFPKCNAYSNKLFINEVLSPMYGDYVEKVLDLTVPEVPTKDLEGNKYIDGISGMYFRNVGHGREQIAKAIYDQISKVSMDVYAGVTPVTVRLAEKLSKITPGDLSKTFFSQGGSLANESSLKLAQAFHMRMGDKGRYKVISRKGSYHGATYHTVWLGGHPGFPREDYQPKPSHVVTVPQPNIYRCEFNSSSEEE